MECSFEKDYGHQKIWQRLSSPTYNINLPTSIHPPSALYHTSKDSNQTITSPPNPAIASTPPPYTISHPSTDAVPLDPSSLLLCRWTRGGRAGTLASPSHCPSTTPAFSLSRNVAPEYRMPTSWFSKLFRCSRFGAVSVFGVWLRTRTSSMPLAGVGSLRRTSLEQTQKTKTTRRQAKKIAKRRMKGSLSSGSERGVGDMMVWGGLVAVGVSVSVCGWMLVVWLWFWVVEEEERGGGGFGCFELREFEGVWGGCGGLERKEGRKKEGMAESRKGRTWEMGRQDYVLSVGVL